MKEKLRRITITLPPKLVKWLDEYNAEVGGKRSTLIKRLLEKYLKDK